MLSKINQTNIRNSWSQSEQGPRAKEDWGTPSKANPWSEIEAWRQNFEKILG